MSPDRSTDAVLLAHIADCIARVNEYAGRSRRAFFDSRLVQDAVVRNLQILSESTQRLSPEIKDTEPSVPWRGIAGFRNVLAHGYLGLDLEAIWTVVEHDLPDLADAVERMADGISRGHLGE